MIYFITYSNDLYSETREYCAKMATKKGKVDKVIVYKPEDIDGEFYSEHADELSLKAGNGLWLWKPYFLNKTLKNVEEGDIVLYCDAGSFFFRSCAPIIESMNDDIWVSDIPLIEKQFTKPELMELMDCKSAEFLNSNQVQANFIAIRKTQRGLKFAKEWLDYCCLPNALTRETTISSAENGYLFIGHRSDQSVLSLLTKKWGVEPHLDPSQYGRVPEKYYAQGRLYNDTERRGEYKPCIILHRGKKPVFKTCLNQWLCTWIPLPVVHLISTPYKEMKKQHMR